MSGIELFAYVLGYVAAVCIGIFSAPQLIRVIKTKDTYTVPLLMYFILAFGSLCFFAQGLINMIVDSSNIKTVLGVTIANFISFVISGTVLVIKLAYRFNARKLNITEEQYCIRHAQEIKNRKGVK